MEQNLKVGSVPGQLIRFAFPLFLSNLLQSCYNLVDMAVVGRFVGGGVLVAQCKGARDEQGQRDAAGALLFVSSAASLLLTAVGLLVYKPFLAAMGLPSEALPQAYGYMRVSLLGTAFVFGYNAD